MDSNWYLSPVPLVRVPVPDTLQQFQKKTNCYQMEKDLWNLNTFLCSRNQKNLGMTAAYCSNKRNGGWESESKHWCLHVNLQQTSPSFNLSWLMIFTGLPPLVRSQFPAVLLFKRGTKKLSKQVHLTVVVTEDKAEQSTSDKLGVISNRLMQEMKGFISFRHQSGASWLISYSFIRSDCWSHL